LETPEEMRANLLFVLWFGSRFQRLGALLVALALLSAPLPGLAADRSESAAYSGLTGIGASLCTLVYAPLKVAYAAGGAVISGFAWAWTLGETDVSGPILRAAVRGDYVVTPSHLEGRRDLRFVGPQY
jgi:hypothetical protein